MSTGKARFSVAGAGITHRGKVRPHNEDTFLDGEVHTAEAMEEARSFHHKADSSWVLAVADGIGGNLAGEQASRETAGLLAGRKDYTPEVVLSMLQYAHQRLFQIGTVHPEQSGLGTTVAGLACGSAGLFVFSVGDSRVYLRQDRYLVQTTKDDCIGEALDTAGQTPPTGRSRQLMRALTQCIGGRFPERTIAPHIIPLDVRNTTRVLICTDGLSETLSREEMEALTATDDSASATTESLLEAALRRGARDNVTLIVADLIPATASV